MQVTITKAEIATAFDDLLTGRRRREEIADWASSVRAADDDGRGLEYVPARAERAIWEALEFLMGVDLRDAPETYLHNQQDVESTWMVLRERLEI